MARTFEEAVAEIKERLDIVEVVSKYVVLKKTGSSYIGLCPFHQDKRPSMHVNPQKGIFKCFSCGAGGDALSFIIKIEGKEFKEVIEELAEQFGIELPKKFAGASNLKPLKDQMIAACAKAVKFYTKNLMTSNDAVKARTYLKSRDITDDVIKEYGLGYAPNKYTDLYNELKSEFSTEVLEKAGLILKGKNNDWIDRFRNRVIIPIRNENGDFVAFGARAIEEGQNPKYLNSSDSLIYNKSKILYGLYHAKNAIAERDGVVIMEGYFDVISAQTHGVKNCVASCGTALTPEHIKLISRYTKSRRIYLSFDTDIAGQNATQKGANIIREAFKGLGNIKQYDEGHLGKSDDRYSCEIRVVCPPNGKDPDEFIRTIGGEEFLNCVNNAPLLIDFILENILKKRSSAASPQEKAEIVTETIDVLKDIDNKIIQSEYVKMVASALDVNENAILQELKRHSNYAEPIRAAAPQNFVTKNLQFSIKAQKNLLSVYLSDTSPLSFSELKEMIPPDIITDKTLIIVKNTIDKITCTINNVRELKEQLFTSFISDDVLTATITDLVYMSEAFNGLTEDEFRTAVKENITRLKRLNREVEMEELRKIYMTVNGDEVEALKVQMQLRDEIKSRIGEHN